MRSRAGILLFALLFAGVLSAQTEPSLGDLEKNLAKVRQVVRANPDSLEGWSQLMMMETVVLQVRAQASGEAASATQAKNETMRERVLAEWRALRPNSAGPELFRVFAIQDQAQQAAAVLGLLDRYPDDPLLLERAGMILRRQGETARYGELLDGFARRQPENPEAYRLLGQYAAQIENWTIAESAYKRWGELRPTDARFVSAWLYSPLARRDPPATAAILERFFAAGPQDAGAFNLCSQVAGQADSPSRAAAVACLGRFAGGNEANLSEQAVGRLAELAAAEGRVGDALAPLRQLAPEPRGRALVAVALALAEKQQCTEAVALIEESVPLLPRDPSRVGGWSGPSGVLRRCAPRPAAEQALLRLIERAPEQEMQGIVSAWSSRIDRGWGTEWEGPLPAVAVATALERRLEKLAAGEAPAPLYRALFNTYQHGGAAAGLDERVLPLLERWERDAAARLDEQAALVYTSLLLAANRTGEAEAMLRRRLTVSPSAKVVEALAGLAAARGDLAAIEALSRDLEGRDDDFSRGLALLLRARMARLRDDLPGALALYRQVAALPSPPDGAVEELVVLAATRLQSSTPVAPLVQELCGLRGVSDRYKNPQECSAELLSIVGREKGAVRVLAEAAAKLPEDVSALRALAQQARSAERFDVASQALRKALDLDPKSAELWAELVELEAEHFALVDVERSIDAARRQLPALPWQVQTARAKAYRRAGDPRQAIAVLHEARALADNDYTLSWTNHWLREAYAEFGRGLSEEVPSADLRPPAPSTPGVEKLAPADLLALAEAWNTGTAQPLVSGGATFDGREAWALFERAARSTDREVALLAQGRLVILLERGRRGVPRDRARAVALWREIAKPLGERAAAGNPRAAYLVATVRLGRIGGSDLPAAKALLDRAASAPPFVGQSWVFHNLGWLAESGVSSPNPRAAMDHYRRAAEAGNVVSRYDLGRMLLASGPLADCQEALRHLEVSAAAGYSVASAYLGKSLLYGGGACLEPNAIAALPHLERAHRAQEDGAAYDLGFALLSGADPRRGVEILSTAPGTLASDLLAFAYATGSAVPRDVAAARRFRAEAARRGSDQWNSLLSAEGPKPLAFFREGMTRLQKLAAAGDPVAQAHLAEFLSQGLFVDADPARAVELARAAAEKGVPEGMRVLADALSEGSGVTKDTAGWLELVRRCAEAGDSFCARSLGHALIHGELVTADRPAGLRWLERAGRSGNAWALLDLGRFYDEGDENVPRDPARAREWMRLAAANGTDEARGWLAWNGSN